MGVAVAKPVFKGIVLEVETVLTESVDRVCGWSFNEDSHAVAVPLHPHQRASDHVALSCCSTCDVQLSDNVRNAPADVVRVRHRVSLKD